ncbi:hypothetical protein SAMN04489844_3336 [Nocardioides exalbidus]|uniref:Uncharacterized protein n=1 Tax=Nocardioides exalbidus TaxID=402596 RepID=A0A1H4WQJ6_9ACTN|nr:hypothetical protein [Nocardioides exalbidus]SEC95603.1 hypothetical protein SAMN04489844_3336 [Nocardioides exalbidus]
MLTRYSLTPDQALHVTTADGTRTIADLRFAPQPDIFVQRDVAPGLKDPSLAASWLVDDLNTLAFHLPVWASRHETLPSVVVGLGAGDEETDRSFGELVCEVRERDGVADFVLHLSRIADQEAPSPVAYLHDEDGGEHVPFRRVLRRILALLPHLDDPHPVRAEFRALLAEYDGPLADAVIHPYVDQVTLQRKLAELAPLMKSDFDAYIEATEGLTAPASVHLASWIREADAHDLAHLAFEYPNADDTELRIAEFFTERGRVFEDRDDMKAPGVQVDLANESLILAVHQSRPEALLDYVADVDEDSLMLDSGTHAMLADLGYIATEKPPR